MKHIATSFANAMHAGAPLAQSYDQNNIILSGANGSLVGRCVDSTSMSMDRAPDFVLNADAYAHFLANDASESGSVGYSEFCARIVETSKKAGDAVTRELFHARNVVKPVVDELTTRMSERCDSLEKDPMAGIEIKRRIAPAVLTHPSLMSSFGRSKEVSVDLRGRNTRLPNYSDNEIIPLMKTGVAQLDELVVLHFAGLGDGWLSTAWRNIYTNNGVRESSNLGGLITGRDGVNMALFMYLTARQLWNNPPKDVDMSSSDYEEAMVHYRDQAAAALCAEMKAIEEDDKAGRLIYSNKRGCLEVLDKPYRDFLAKGGSNETLLGFSISGDDFVDVDQILSNKELYCQNWERYEVMNKTAFSNRRFTAVVDGLLIEYDYMTNTSSEEQFPTALRGVARQRFQAELRKIKTDDLKNLPQLCMRLITRSRFPVGNSEFILSGIQRVCDDNPKVGPREAVAVVTIELLTKFFAQFVRKINVSEANPRI